MTRFVDMTDFHKGVQFFMQRPSPAIGAFIITVLSAVCAALVWAVVAQMDDVVKVSALLRPNATISLLRANSGGEVLEKNYSHGDSVKAGDLLLRIDVSSDALELVNSENLMERLQENIVIDNALIDTIKTKVNAAPQKDGEAYIRSAVYLIEREKLLADIETLRIALNREKSKHEIIIVRSQIEDIERNIQQAELQFSLWENNQMINALNSLKASLQSRESLERRIADLELNIKNAALYAPIDGVINELRRLNRGDRVFSGEDIVSIIPGHEQGLREDLKAELWVDPAYVARIQTGQKVALRFPGLPPSKFGKAEAIVSLIPADYSIGPDAMPVFVVEAYLPEPWLTGSDGKPLYLRAGIAAEGRVIIDHDTVLRMILKKLDFINSAYNAP